jgi:hypothetical protein
VSVANDRTFLIPLSPPLQKGETPSPTTEEGFCSPFEKGGLNTKGLKEGGT